jgi:hypothetical protein
MGYLIVGPLILINLMLVFGLFAAQFIAVQGIYNSAANPQKIFEKAFQDAGGFLAGKSPEKAVAERLGVGGVPSPVVAGLTRAVWFCYGGVQWGILLFLLFAMLRDLGMTSWAFLAAPYQREVQGRPWMELIRGALSRFLHIFLYSLFATVFFAITGLGVLVVSWLTLRMVAGLLVTYLVAVSSGSALATLLFASFYVAMLEILALLFLATGLLSFIASRSISLHVEKTLGQFFDLPLTNAVIPKLWPPTKGAALLMGKVLAATVPTWLLMGFVVGPFFPLVLASPLGAVFHIAGFNVALALMGAHRDLKPLLVEAWAGRPWSRSVPPVVPGAPPPIPGPEPAPPPTSPRDSTGQSPPPTQ